MSVGDDGPVGPSTGAGTWSGPTQIEFWQGRENRMHDRFLYTRKTGDEGVEHRAAGSLIGGFVSRIGE